MYINKEISDSTNTTSSNQIFINIYERCLNKSIGFQEVNECFFVIVSISNLSIFEIRVCGMTSPSIFYEETQGPSLVREMMMFL